MALEEYSFFRCAICGKVIKPRWLKMKNIINRKGVICKCGSKRFSPTNVPVWYEIIYLIFHPLKIKKTILWPSNWRYWRKWYAEPYN